MPRRQVRQGRRAQLTSGTLGETSRVAGGPWASEAPLAPGEGWRPRVASRADSHQRPPTRAGVRTRRPPTPPRRVGSLGSRTPRPLRSRKGRGQRSPRALVGLRGVATLPPLPVPDPLTPREPSVGVGTGTRPLPCRLWRAPRGPTSLDRQVGTAGGAGAVSRRVGLGTFLAVAAVGARRAGDGGPACPSAGGAAAAA